MSQMIGLFCEDIREEASGQHTIVGVMPDNFQHPGDFPIAIPKLGIYLRVHIGVEEEPTPLSATLELGEFVQQFTDFDADFIRKAQTEAASTGSPFAGLITKAVAAPFPINGLGRLRLVVTRRGQATEVAGLNITSAPAPNVSEQHPEQSEPGVRKRAIQL
jgi:hypothetical protein